MNGALHDALIHVQRARKAAALRDEPNPIGTIPPSRADDVRVNLRFAEELLTASGSQSMDDAMLTASQVRETRWRAYLAGYDAQKAELDDGPLDELFHRWCEHEDEHEDGQ
jgi:hypothetical protein